MITLYDESNDSQSSIGSIVESDPHLLNKRTKPSVDFMAKSLREIMSGKSDEGLMEYLNNFQKYTPEAIRSAVDELKRRGRNFNEEELREM